jgi:hypothetical protein
LILVTGAIGAGKTAFCLAAVAWARARGWQAAGLVSPPVFENGVKIGIDVEDVSSGERRRLARRRVGEVEAAIATTGWVFDPEALQWGNQVLENALPCDLLVVDELGPLEFERGQGWLAGLAALDSRRYRLGLASIRPELLNRARQRWPDAGVEEIRSLESAFLTVVDLLGTLEGI